MNAEGKLPVWACTSSERADGRRLLQANHNILTQMTHSLHTFPCIIRPCPSHRTLCSLYTCVFFLNCSHLLKKKPGYSPGWRNFVCIWPLKLNNKLRKITQYDTRYRRLWMWLSAQPWNSLWSGRVPIGLKGRAKCKLYIFVTMQQCNCPEMRAKVLDRCEAARCRRDALMWSRFERVKEDAVQLNHSRCCQMTDLIW